MNFDVCSCRLVLGLNRPQTVTFVAWCLSARSCLWGLGLRPQLLLHGSSCLSAYSLWGPGLDWSVTKILLPDIRTWPYLASYWLFSLEPFCLIVHSSLQGPGLKPRLLLHKSWCIILESGLWLAANHDSYIYFSRFLKTLCFGLGPNTDGAWLDCPSLTYSSLKLHICPWSQGHHRHLW